jgi:hypothetical protein
MSKCLFYMLISGTSVSSTSKIHRHDIAEILLKVALSTIKPNHLHKDVTDRGLWYRFPFNVDLLKGASFRSQKFFQTTQVAVNPTTIRSRRPLIYEVYVVVSYYSFHQTVHYCACSSTISSNCTLLCVFFNFIYTAKLQKVDLNGITITIAL